MTEPVQETTTAHFADDGQFPNSPLPLIVYHKAIAEDVVSAESFEAVFAENDWPPRWRWGVYDFHHYHSTSHETLGVARGHAQVRFGGPAGETFEVAAGDAVLIPAGVAHKLESASDDFLVVGAYPPGLEADLLRGEEGERPGADARIAALSLPETDPVCGDFGPLGDNWR